MTVSKLVDSTVTAILECQKNAGVPCTLDDPAYRFFHVLVVAGMEIGRDLPKEVTRAMCDELIARVKSRGERVPPPNLSKN